MAGIGPKSGDRVKALRDVKVAGNRHIKVLDSVGPDTLEKGTRGEVTRVDERFVDVTVEWMKSNLRLRVEKVVWGVSFG